MPDFILRRGIRLLLQQRLQELKQPTLELQQKRLMVRYARRALPGMDCRPPRLGARSRARRDPVWPRAPRRQQPRLRLAAILHVLSQRPGGRARFAGLHRGPATPPGGGADGGGERAALRGARSAPQSHSRRARVARWRAGREARARLRRSRPSSTASASASTSSTGASRSSGALLGARLTQPVPSSRPGSSCLYKDLNPRVGLDAAEAAMLALYCERYAPQQQHALLTSIGPHRMRRARRHAQGAAGQRQEHP